MAECTTHGRSLPRREGFAPHFPLCAITVNPHRGSISLFCSNPMNPTILAALALVATVSWVQSATVVFSARGHVTGALGTVYSPAGLGSEVEVLVTIRRALHRLRCIASHRALPARQLFIGFELDRRTNHFSNFRRLNYRGHHVRDISCLAHSGAITDGNDLFFLFRDDDRSFVSSDALPTSYGSITDWDRIDLSVLLNPAMWPAPSSNPLDVSFSATSIPELSTTALVAFGTILGLSRRHRDYPKRQNKPSLSTPISRPVYMLSRSFNLNPVIDARSR